MPDFAAESIRAQQVTRKMHYKPYNPFAWLEKLSDEDAKKHLVKSVDNWKRYTFENEYREYFGGGDPRKL